MLQHMNGGAGNGIWRQDDAHWQTSGQTEVNHSQGGYDNKQGSKTMSCGTMDF